MTPLLTYPRLDRTVAATLLEEYRRLSPNDLTQLVATSHSGASWHPTSPHRADAGTLEQVREAVVGTAGRCSWPAPIGARSRTLTRFDQQVAAELYTAMHIVTAEAAQEGVWSFLTLVLLPDVAMWRYPPTQHHDRGERLLGTPRNVFRKLWWRARVLGADPASPNAELLEDEAVGIMERPTLSGSPRVARAIATEHLRQIRANPDISRTELLRAATKRIRRYTSLISLPMLMDPDLQSLVNEAFDASVTSLRTLSIE